MGIGTNIIVIWFCMTFALYLIGMETTFTAILNGRTGILTDQILVTIAVSAGVGIVASVFGGSIQSGVIAAIVVALVSFVSFPTGFVGEAALPTQIELFISGIFSMMWLVALISWYRGMEM